MTVEILTNSSFSRTTVTTNATTWAYAVQINGWVFAEETGQPGPTSASNMSSCSFNDGALDTGDKIGIGIGVGMGVIGLATLAAGLIMMRRSRRTRRHASEAPSSELLTHQGLQLQQTPWGPTESPETRDGHGTTAGIKYGRPPSELPNLPNELHSRLL